MDESETQALLELTEAILLKAYVGDDLEESFISLVLQHGIKPGLFALACSAASVIASRANPLHLSGNPADWFMYPDFSELGEETDPKHIWAGRMVAAIGNHDFLQAEALFDVEVDRGLGHLSSYVGGLVGTAVDAHKDNRDGD